MPVLENPRHEKFAQLRAKGKTADEAYEGAGFKPNRGNAARLNANDNIRKRIEEITSRVAEKAEWTAADRMMSLKAIHDASLSEDRRTAIAAIAEANKMQGSHAPRKNELAGPNGGPVKIDLTNLPPDEIERLISLFGHLASVTDDDAEDAAGGEG